MQDVQGMLRPGSGRRATGRLGSCRASCCQEAQETQRPDDKISQADQSFEKCKARRLELAAGKAQTPDDIEEQWEVRGDRRKAWCAEPSAKIVQATAATAAAAAEQE